MSEIIKKRVSESIGKNIKIYLNNGFKFSGKIINCDEKYIEIFDEIIKGYKILEISNIVDLEVSQWGIKIFVLRVTKYFQEEI